jgi:hypothetical protein
MSSHYHVQTVVVYGKMGQVCWCALGIMLKNSVMSMESLVFVTQGVLHYNKLQYNKLYQFTGKTLRTQGCS